MRLPKMTPAELAVFGATFACHMSNSVAKADNSQAEAALDAALWHVQCFRQAVRERKED